MEARKILFVLSNSSSQKSIMSEAETLGALKADMRRAGINYENMTFFEGRTRTELKDDASVLPTNVPVAAKGTVPASTTNELVFMLTTANKKIASGALSGERKAILEEIKAKGLSRAVIAKFGKNSTQCKTPDLIAFLSEATPTTVDDALSIITGLTEEQALKLKNDLIAAGATLETEESKPEVTAPVQVGPCVDVQARGVLKRLIDKLMNEYGLEENYEELLDDLKTEEAPTETKKVEDDKLSKDEINGLFGGWTE